MDDASGPLIAPRVELDNLIQHNIQQIASIYNLDQDSDYNPIEMKEKIKDFHDTYTQVASSLKKVNAMELKIEGSASYNLDLLTNELSQTPLTQKTHALLEIPANFRKIRESVAAEMAAPAPKPKRVKLNSAQVFDSATWRKEIQDDFNKRLAAQDARAATQNAHILELLRRQGNLQPKVLQPPIQANPLLPTAMTTKNVPPYFYESEKTYVNLPALSTKAEHIPLPLMICSDTNSLHHPKTILKDCLFSSTNPIGTMSTLTQRRKIVEYFQQFVAFTPICEEDEESESNLKWNVMNLQLFLQQHRVSPPTPAKTPPPPPRQLHPEDQNQALPAHNH